MKFFDITLPLSSRTIAWPGDTRFKRSENRGSAIVSKITMSSHSGTHMDAPRHFLFSRGGIDEIPLSKLVGQAKVFFTPAVPLITRADVMGLPIEKGDKVLFKTRNSKLLKRKDFTKDYVSLSLPAAEFLAKKKIDLVGIDYFGIEAKSAPGHPVHKALLKAGIIIVEGLDLSRVKSGTYHMAALPLKIREGDGAPARVVLWK